MPAASSYRACMRPRLPRMISAVSILRKRVFKSQSLLNNIPRNLAVVFVSCSARCGHRCRNPHPLRHLHRHRHQHRGHPGNREPYLFAIHHAEHQRGIPSHRNPQPRFRLLLKQLHPERLHQRSFLQPRQRQGFRRHPLRPRHQQRPDAAGHLHRRSRQFLRKRRHLHRNAHLAISIMPTHAAGISAACGRVRSSHPSNTNAPIPPTTASVPVNPRAPHLSAPHPSTRNI